MDRDRSGANKENAKNMLASAEYCSLKEALTHKWSGMTRRQTKELNPAVVFAVLCAFFLLSSCCPCTTFFPSSETSFDLGELSILTSLG